MLENTEIKHINKTLDKKQISQNMNIINSKYKF